jgi:hypothetical protein
MTDPRIVALASMVPGLGFAIQAKYRQAVTTILLFGALVLVFLYAPWEWLYQLSCTFLMLAWIGQGYLAYDGARRDRRIRQGEAVPPRQVMPVSAAPAGVPRGQRLKYQVRRTLEQQTLPGEHLKEVLFATAMPSFRSHLLYGLAAGFAARQHYIGLTRDGLLLLQLDFWGKPAEILRILRSDVTKASFRKGMVTGSLRIERQGDSPLHLQVPRVQWEAAQAIADDLSGSEEVT